jgi:PST family polysaccharide transporter
VSFKLVINNIVWQSSEKILRMALGLFVGLWLARYLGPTQFGVLNFVTAWLGMFSAIAWLGVGETAMRDMLRNREEECFVMGSSFIIRTIGSVLAISLALASAYTVGKFEREQLLALAILCIGVPFAEAPAGIWLWFASHLNIRPAVLGKNGAMIISALLKIWLILEGDGLLSVFIAVALESVLYGIFLVIAYWRQGERILAWRFDFTHALSMLVTGLPIVLSALVISLNARLDQLLLGWLGTMTDVGIYSAATRFSEIWWVVPPMIVQTLAAKYIYPKDLGSRLFENVEKIVTGLALLSILPCFLLMAIGSEIISLILGVQYFGASDVLVIHIWTAVFVFVDAPINQYLLAINRQSVLVLKSVLLLSLNLLLALLLIPAFGPQGAAAATLIAQALVVIILPMLHPSLRDVRNIFINA